MTLKYENEDTQTQDNVESISPLYGDAYRPPARRKRAAFKEKLDISMLREEEIIEALKYAEEVYSRELMRLGYSPLTIGSYSSSVGRFIQFSNLDVLSPIESNK